MFAKSLVVAAMAIAPLAALAADRSVDAAQYRNVTSPSNQGTAFMYQVPVNEQAPYALTGPQSRQSTRWAAVQIGNGGYVRVRVPAE